ncbi:hypothetical protein [Campylobacter sp. RM12651]|uniref:hypothetical protein n=1 Tax=Campylobacter sp. RM12651 TaxID=1660079 RepID=UPI001EFAC798|nr:hypothetical protein [Campylobacter sp. RM12651]ULO04536.1 hypothetical protein AVBRAN_a0054 [Campylobacter sp. RM12651]
MKFLLEEMRDEAVRIEKVDAFVKELADELECDLLKELEIGACYFSNDDYIESDFTDRGDFNINMKGNIVLSIVNELEIQTEETNTENIQIALKKIVEYFHMNYKFNF